MHFNIRSLSSKFDELKLLLAQLEEKILRPDIIMLCETWLNDVNKDLFSLVLLINMGKTLREVV